jgi:hypothetical protein
VNPGPGDSYAFSVWARSIDTGCVNFTLALFAAGITNESQQTHTKVCGTTWQLFSAPLDAQYINTFLRAQIYVDDANRFLDIDATELIQLMTKKSSFENSDGFDSIWNRIHPSPHPPYDTNWVRRGTAGPCPPTQTGVYSGPCELTASREAGGGGTSSVYQDVYTIPSSGEVYTFWVWLRQGGPLPQPSTTGSIRIWAMGGTSQGSTPVNFTLTPSWQLLSTSITVQPGHTSLRVEVYLNNTNVNYDIDGAKFWKAN